MWKAQIKHNTLEDGQNMSPLQGVKIKYWPVCTKLCFLRLESSAKLLVHPSLRQTNGFSPAIPINCECVCHKNISLKLQLDIGNESTLRLLVVYVTSIYMWDHVIWTTAPDMNCGPVNFFLVWILVKSQTDGKRCLWPTVHKHRCVKNDVTLFDTMPRILCPLLPKLLSFAAPWSFWPHAL